jgi:hypothetical protein
VIAAAPVKPVAAIVTTRMIPGKPKAAIFLTSSSILPTFAVAFFPLPTSCQHEKPASATSYLLYIVTLP